MFVDYRESFAMHCGSCPISKSSPNHVVQVMRDPEVRFERLRPVEFGFIDESGGRKVAGSGVISEREDGIESATVGSVKRKGRRRHLNKDCIVTKGEVEVL